MAPSAESHQKGSGTLVGRVQFAELDPRFEQRDSTPVALPKSRLFAADLNADGRTDLFAVEPDSLSLWVTLSNEHTFAPPSRTEGLSPDCNWNRVIVSAPPRRAIRIFAPSSSHSELCLAELEEMRITNQRLHFPAELSFPAHGQLTGATDELGLTTFIDAAEKNRIYRFRQLDHGGGLDLLPDVAMPVGVIPAGLGDLDGNGEIDVAAISPRNSVLRCELHAGAAGCTLWLETLRGKLGHSRLIAGDFNGDGRSDILERMDSRNPISGSGLWLGLSTEVTGLEREVRGPAPRIERDTEVVVGDYDGDGAEELLIPRRAEGRLEIWRLRPGRNVPEARLVLDETKETVSATDGSYRFDGIEPGMHTIDFENGTAQQHRRKVWVRNKRTSTANILLDDREQNRGTAFALNGPREGPAVCLGYLPMVQGDSEKWGGVAWRVCPAGYAVFAGSIQKGTLYHELLGLTSDKQPGAYTTGTCCKLPAADVLSEIHTTALDRCPENSVATGIVAGSCGSSCVALRCTQINTERYQLGKSTPGVYWGVDIGMLHQSPRMLRADIPAAIREGVGRNNFDTWERDGCIGSPFGSLLVEKGVNRCTGFAFRELQYRGASGDAAPGTPVKMYPSCERVRNPFDPLSDCGP